MHWIRALQGFPTSFDVMGEKISYNVICRYRCGRKLIDHGWTVGLNANAYFKNIILENIYFLNVYLVFIYTSIGLGLHVKLMIITF